LRGEGKEEKGEGRGGERKKEIIAVLCSFLIAKKVSIILT
jgi:hypothetical protein